MMYPKGVHAYGDRKKIKGSSYQFRTDTGTGGRRY